MGERGQVDVSPNSFDDLVKTLLSAVETSNPFGISQTSQRDLHWYDKASYKNIETHRIASIKPFRLLQVAANLQIQILASKERRELNWEPWFEFIRMPSEDPDPYDRQEILNREDHSQGAATSHQSDSVSGHTWKCRKGSFFSMSSKYGRIDIRTLTYTAVEYPDAFDYAGEIILALPRNDVGSAQLRFRLSEKVTRESSTFLTPVLSMRRMIPSESKIFKIASSGTVNELRDMLLAGAASLQDCDMNGRSLLNVSV
jgi:hypothetical protein